MKQDAFRAELVKILQGWFTVRNACRTECLVFGVLLQIMKENDGEEEGNTNQEDK